MRTLKGSNFIFAANGRQEWPVTQVDPVAEYPLVECPEAEYSMAEYLPQMAFG